MVSLKNLHGKTRIDVAEFRSLYGLPPLPGENKYHAKKEGGHASRKEHRRSERLRLLQASGEISELREQVTYELIPVQRGGDGKVIERAVKYIADFVYKDRAGNMVVEDTKGMRTPEYVIKRKLMLYIHGIRIVEI